MAHPVRNKSGHHDTSVHETVAPAVTQETVNKTEHQNVTTAVDKEVHQDHYHTSIQPVKDTEVLPETHHHKVIPVEHRKIEHDDHEKNKHHLATQAAQFKNESVRVEGQHTASVKPIVAGEHVHHHVHETIQPVVQKQTIEPHVRLLPPSFFTLDFKISTTNIHVPIRSSTLPSPSTKSITTLPSTTAPPPCPPSAWTSSSAKVVVSPAAKSVPTDSRASLAPRDTSSAARRPANSPCKLLPGKGFEALYQ
jgi:hypothetical protein